MSDVEIEGRGSDKAILLLAAAKDLGLDPKVVVRTTSTGYIVPEEVAKQAEKPTESPKKEAAKKTAAKKAPAKKTAAKKTAPKE